MLKWYIYILWTQCISHRGSQHSENFDKTNFLMLIFFLQERFETANHHFIAHMQIVF